jgi:thiol-disulfide isomerase/thioredoxin
MVRLFVLSSCACVALALSSCEKPATSTPATPTDAAQSDSTLGKPAEPFKTVNPDGETIDLKEHLGKNVIMLDFWATWCGPCLMAMPEVEEVAQKFTDRGLVFYAVNVGEDPDTVKEFLAQSQLDVPVAMDFDGKIHGAFGDQGLPHTVVIGKDGRVQVDHLGYWQGFGEQLAEEVEQLLDGKSLVE